MTLDNATINALARAITPQKLADFFSDPVNLEGFEAWKAERDRKKLRQLMDLLDDEVRP